MSFNTAEEISELLRDGHTLKFIAQNRKKCLSKVPLCEFYADFGRAFLDGAGNLVRAGIGDITPKDLMPDIPQVVSVKEFWQYLEARKCNGETLPEICFRAWFDSRPVIESYITTTDRLVYLLSARRKACEEGYSLKSWIVVGHFKLGSDGTAIKIWNPAPCELIQDILPVVDCREYEGYFEVRKREEYPFETEATIPGSRNICPFCGLGWEIGNCHDLVEHHERQFFELDKWAADKTLVTLGNVRKFFKSWRDGSYCLDCEHPIANPAYIDLSPSRFSSDRFKMPVNEQGFVPDSNRPDYRIRHGDIIRLDVWKFYHGICHAKRQLERKIKSTRFMFESAGLAPKEEVRTVRESDDLDLEATYCPLLTVKTEMGEFLIRWKDGIRIEWGKIDPELGERMDETAKEIVGLRNRISRAVAVSHVEMGTEVLKQLRLGSICRLSIEHQKIQQEA